MWKSDEVVKATQIGFPIAVPINVGKNGNYEDLEKRVEMWFPITEIKEPNAYMLGEPYDLNLTGFGIGLGRKMIFPVTYYIIEEQSTQEKL